jgi:hypothetical protein
MRSGAVVTLLAVIALGLIGLVGVAARDSRDLAFTIGVVPSLPTAELAPGARVCQTPITVSEPFARIRVRVGTPALPGQPLEVTVRDAATSRRLARGTIAGGYSAGTDQTAFVGPVTADRKIGVCVRNLGKRREILYGNLGGAALPSTARMGQRELDNDMTVVFLKRDSDSMLGRLAEVFDRASVFRPGWVGPWVFWVLTALVLAGVPLLLARALADSADAP